MLRRLSVFSADFLRTQVMQTALSRGEELNH